MRVRALILLSLSLGAGLHADGSPEGARPDLARIDAPQALTAWTSALQGLSVGTRSRVSVVHIGDSHLQAGPMDSVLRQALQARWGDAGRGFVFPYEATDTANPPDLASASDVEWKLRRMMGDSAHGPVGAGGLAAVAQAVPFVLSLAQGRDVAGTPGFDRVRVFYEPGPDKAELWVATRPDPVAAEAALRRAAWRERLIEPGDTLSELAQAEGVSQADLRRWNGPNFKLRAGKKLRLRQVSAEGSSRLAGYTVWGVLKGDDERAREGVSVSLGSPVQELFLVGTQAGPGQDHVELQGLLFERSLATGLVWNTLAANGAQAKHFSAQRNFPVQLKAMDPDLIIFSLGTNETQQSDYAIDDALAEQKRLWKICREAVPGASLLVLSPPEASYGKRTANARLDPYVQGLRALALQEGAAFFDLRAAQGGYGSYDRWHEEGLAGKDGVHYRNAGYRLMGQWLLDALDNTGAAHAP